MKKLMIPVVFVASLLLTEISANAAWTGSSKIKTFKVETAGLLIKLEDFSLADVDPSACGDPVGAYLWLASTESGYEERFATLLSAFLSERKVNISYYHCGDYFPSAPYLKLGSVSMSAN
jgi:hypothetical protein